MSYSWAKPGVKVVCLRSGWDYCLFDANGLEAPSREPMINEILTISDVWPSEYQDEICLSFVEMGHGCGFPVKWFRPLTAKSQDEDIALFRHLLTGVDAEVGA